MRQIYLLIFVFSSISIFSQEKLKIVYEGVYSLDETHATSKFHGRFVPSEFELIIAGDFSEFKYIEKIHSQQEDDRPPAPMTSDNYYINLKSNEFFVKQDIFGKTYLVSDTLKTGQWVLTKEEKTLAGVMVRKATMKTEYDEITAWYAPKIAYKIGPELYNGLPGIILQLDIYSETQEKAIFGQHYKAVSIEVLNDNYKIKLPKGNVISNDEAERIEEEQFNKILEMNRGGVDKD